MSIAARPEAINRPRQSAATSSPAKRLLDLTASAVGLLLLSPLLAAVYLLVRLDSAGPGFYTARRAGLYGRPFRMYKLRTMCVGADQKLAELQAANLSGPLMIRIPDDPRVTRVGRWLRRSGLDELPQLWNVLKGDMSLVGPRPWATNEAAKLGEQANAILSVRPGLTGLWQVRAWDDPDPAARIALDLEYVERWTFPLDLRLLVQTPLSMLRKRFAPRRANG